MTGNSRSVETKLVYEMTHPIGKKLLTAATADRLRDLEKWWLKASQQTAEFVYDRFGARNSPSSASEFISEIC